MTQATNLKSVQDCFLVIGEGKVGGVDANHVSDCARVANFLATSPVMGALVTAMLVKRYKRANNISRATAMDWGAFLQWLTENLPAILQIIMTLITFFG
jgi:hypothetical protein